MDTSNYEITDTMIRFGGSFVQALGHAFCVADSDNQAKLKTAFPEYWKQYKEMREKILEVKK